MTEALSPKEVAHVARLARLGLSDTEIDRFTKDLTAVLRHVEDIEKVDTSNVEPTAHPSSLSNVFRQDDLDPSRGIVVTREQILAQAPAVEDNKFKVPPGIG